MTITFATNDGTVIKQLAIPDEDVEKLWSPYGYINTDHLQDRYLGQIVLVATEAARYYDRRPR